MHVLQSRFLRQGEVWFDQEPDQTRVDWIHYRQRPNPVPGAKWNYFYTLVVDLESSPEALLDGCNKSTKYRIRRARDGDKFICESAHPITREALDSFAQMYEPFATHKGLPSL